MRIAIIDDGVATGAINLPLECYKVINGQVQSVPLIVNPTSSFSHGTICAKIVEKNIVDATIISLSIYSEFSDGVEADLLVALQWCLDNSIDFINMSNGETCYFNNNQLNELCYLLWKQGSTLVAAISNQWEYTAPAHFPYVIGVSRKEITHKCIVHADMIINGFTVYKNRNGHFQVDFQNSFACAQITNYLALHSAINCCSRKKEMLHRHFCDFSLLRDVYTICDDSFESQNLSFDFTRYIGQEINSHRATIVVTEPYTNRATIDILSELSTKVGLLIWCNSSMPRNIWRWCMDNNISYWIASGHNTNFSLIKQQRSLSFEDNIIVIHDYDNSTNDALRLRNLFENDGYNAIVFSNEKHGYLFGMHYAACRSYVEMVYEQAKPDVIIFIESTRNYSIDWDFYIYSTTDGLILEGRSGHQMSTPCNIESIYRTIIEAATEEDELKRGKD